MTNEEKDAWSELANRIFSTPFIYDDGDGVTEASVVWVGKPVFGVDAVVKIKSTIDAKMEEYSNLGNKAFEDSEPLENALLPNKISVDCDIQIERPLEIQSQLAPLTPQEEIQKMMMEWAREDAFTPSHVTCARCRSTDIISMDSGNTGNFSRGYLCEKCEPND